MKSSNKTKIAAMLFILPSFLGIIVFYIIPYIICFTNSLHNGNDFVGLENYFNVIKSPAFLTAVKNTLILMGVGIPLLLIVSFLIALLLNSFGKVKAFFQSTLLIPVVAPVASLVFVWQLFFEDTGIINSLLNGFGIDGASYFNSGFGMVMIILIYVWKNCGFCVLLFTAGLANVPKSLSESARLDGASGFRLITKITLPLITPTTFFAFLFAVLYSNTIFREVFTLFGDYPDESVYFLQNFINNNYHSMNYPNLSAASIVFSILVIAMLFVLFAFERKRSYLE